MKTKFLAVTLMMTLVIASLAGCGFSIGEEKPIASVSWDNKNGFSTENYIDKDKKDNVDDPEDTSSRKKKADLTVGGDDSALPPAGSEKRVILPLTNISMGTLSGTEPNLTEQSVEYYLDDTMYVVYTTSLIPVGDKNMVGEAYDALPSSLSDAVGFDIEPVDIGQYELDGEDFYIGIFKADSDLARGIYVCFQDVGVSDYVCFTVFDGDYSGEDDAVNACFNIADMFPGTVGSQNESKSAINPAGTTSGGGTVTLYIGKNSIDLPEVLETPKGNFEMTTGKDYYVSYKKDDTYVSYADSYITVGDSSSAKEWMEAYKEADFRSDELTLNNKQAYVVRVPYSNSKEIHILQDIGAANYIYISVDTTDAEFSDKEVMETFALSNK